MKPIFNLILIFSLFMFYSIVYADYSAEMKEEENFLNETFRDIKANIRQLKNATNLISLSDPVKVIVDSSDIPSVSVGLNPKSQNTEIRITPTFSLINVYIADVVTFGTYQPEFDQCESEYNEYLFRTLANNRNLSAKSLSRNRELSPELYFTNISSNICHKYKDSFPIPQNLRVVRDRLVKMLYFFAYMHELGHLAKSHPIINYGEIDTSLPVPLQVKKFIKLTAISRMNEYEADNWAIDNLVKYSDSPLELVNPFFLSHFVIFGGYDCSLELTKTHPNGFQRFSNFMDHLRVKLNQKYGKIPDKYDEVITDTIKLADKSSRLFKCSN